MKEITCESGNKFGIALAYGILKELETSVFEMMEPHHIEQLKGMWSNTSVTEVTAEQQAKFIEVMDGAGLKSFLLANSRQAADTVAKVLRTVNGESIGENYEERREYVMYELDLDDGNEISDYIQSKLEMFKQGAAQQGESKPSSEAPVEKAAAQ